MTADPQLADALLRLHSKAGEWLKRSSVEEEAAWREQIKVLESEAACETDNDKREQTERRIRELQELLDNQDNRLTDAYANLIFAYGLARIGARTESASLEASTAQTLKTDDAVHRLLSRAFTYRISQAREGGPCRGPLPPELLAPPSERGPTELESRLTRYKFNSIRKRVLILEPAEEVNPFRDWMKPRTRLERVINSLYGITEPDKLERRTRRLLAKCAEAGKKVKVLAAALDLFPRLPPSFARSVLETAYGILGSLPPVGDLRKRERERRTSLESLDPLSEAYSEAKAAHDKEFRDLRDLLDRLAVMEVAARRAADGSDAALLKSVIRSLIQMVEAQRGEDIFHAIPVLAGRCLQSLQRLHLRAELDQLLQQVTALLQSQPHFFLRRGGNDENRGTNLRLLLNIAAGWLFLGRSDLAAPMIEEARAFLLAAMPNRHSIDMAEVACRYVAALALSPLESALKGLDELFPGIGPLGDMLTTNSHFSQVRLQIIDAVVRAVVHLAHPEDDVDDYLAVSLN